MLSVLESLKEDVLVLAKFGSHVYGTNIPESDEDYKFIFTPEPKDILLKKHVDHLNRSVKKSDSINNQAGDIDCEGLSLQKFLYDLCKGQTYALDIIHTPMNQVLFPNNRKQALWAYIQRNKDKLITRNLSPFIGYARAQVTQYCVKAERYNAIKETVETLEALAKDKHLYPTVESAIPSLSHIKDKYPMYVELIFDKGRIPMFSCCGRKVMFTFSISNAIDIFRTTLDDYGARVIKASEMGSKDWKALYHGVRISEECKELLTTGTITFPRPEAPLLLKIRRGEIPASEVFSMMDNYIYEIEGLVAKSTLPEKPDEDFIEWLLIEEYGFKVYSYIADLATRSLSNDGVNV